MKKFVSICLSFLMLLSLTACGGESKQPNSEISTGYTEEGQSGKASSSPEATKTETSESNSSVSSEPAESEDEESEKEESTAESSGISPEFQEAMDSYEAFFDEYIEFMKTYSTSDDVTGMLSDYADYMAQYTETMEKLEAINEDQLSAEEALYYAEVTTRISQKLLEVAE